MIRGIRILPFFQHVFYFYIVDDTVLYKVQAAYCSGSTYTFSCDKPDHVMWVGQGLIWGTKHNSAPDNETCMPREGDCQHAELDNQLLDVSVDNSSLKNFFCEGTHISLCFRTSFFQYRNFQDREILLHRANLQTSLGWV